jgi:HSP20 family protein
MQAQIRNLTEGLEKTWHSIADGWDQLVHRASNALTYFGGDKGQSENGQSPARHPGWGLLSADVYDEGDKLIVKLEVPGLTAGDFDINITNSTLVVSGEKYQEHDQTRGEYRVMERVYGRFSRSIPLDYEIDADSASANYKHGVLTITVEKQPDQHKRRIVVS